MSQLDDQLPASSERLAYSIVHAQALTPDAAEKLAGDLQALLTAAWGAFEPGFIGSLLAPQARASIALARERGELVGFCIVRSRRLAVHAVIYVELAALSPVYQRANLGPWLMLLAMRRRMVAQFLRSGLRHVDVVFISPNIRTLVAISRRASNVYPDLTEAREGRLPQADKLSWEIAQAAIAGSSHPERRLDREGLVLHGSYADTPWLLYRPGNAPLHEHACFSDLARRYLGFDSREDREFVVRARFGMAAFLWLALRRPGRRLLCQGCGAMV